jgi:hypothetical protein
MGFNIAGGVTGSLQEVETATLAGRITLRPTDPVSLGAYLLATDNGTTVMTAALAANSPIFAFRWGNANLCVLNSIKFGLTTTTAFAAGRIAIQAFFARSFTASDTGGTALTLTGNNCKKRTSFGTNLLTDARISATATLTAGTRTLDAQPFGEIAEQSVVASANTVIPAYTPLLIRESGDQYPIVFAQNEGFVIQATVPGTGTWFFSVVVDWLEIASY